MITRATYSLLLYLLLPLIVIRLLWRGLQAPAYRHRWGERFGFYRNVKIEADLCIQPPSPLSSCKGEGVEVWLHAVSVGEFVAAIPLIRTLMEELPEEQILVTTMTPTGSARVLETFGAKVQHCYLPYDLPGAVSRFLNHYHPALAVVMETELWPNLFHQCGKQQIPLILANVRLSQRSLQGYQRWIPRLAKEALQQVSWAAVQSDADRDRLIQLGIDVEKATITGSIKFDMTLPESLPAEGKKLRDQLGGDRLVWIAASTREGEEGHVLEAHQQILQQTPDALLILVPRHPERFDGVFKQAQSAGFTVVRRSENLPPSRPSPLKGEGDQVFEIYLGDTMGEMLLLYAAADLAYVGGSLVPTGSHNMLEPAALGKPVLFGAHRFNFAEISQLLIDQGAAREVQNANELAEQVVDLLQNPQRSTEMGHQGARVVEQNRGALQRLLTGIRAHLPE